MYLEYKRKLKSFENQSKHSRYSSKKSVLGYGC